DAAAPASASLSVDGKLDAADGTGLAALLRLDRLAVVDRQPPHVTISANGPANGDLKGDGSFAGGGPDAPARRTLRYGDARPRGSPAVSFAAAAARLPRHDSALPVRLTTHLTVDGDDLTFDKLDGSVARTALKGRVALGLGTPRRIDADLDVDTIDAGAV